jgi:hypothetical protein
MVCAERRKVEKLTSFMYILMNTKTARQRHLRAVRRLSDLDDASQRSLQVEVQSVYGHYPLVSEDEPGGGGGSTKMDRKQATQMTAAERRAFLNSRGE